MRRTLGLALLMGLFGSLIGCFTSGSQPPVTVASVGPPTGDKEHTLEYWGKVREAMRLQTTSPDMRQVAAVVRQEADMVRQLPVDGVDLDLVVAANAVAQCQEKMLAAASTANYNRALLRADPDLQHAYSEALQQTSAAITRLKALHSKLSARYGVTFAPIEDK
jgi:hypothetical protein